MKRMEMPPNIRGGWIWRGYGNRQGESFVLFRREFPLENPGLEAILRISAETTYELLVNDRLFGSGPRPHNDPGRSYADCYDVGCALQSGNNVIAVIVYFAGTHGGEDERLPGLWCQLEIDRQPYLWTDERWQLRDGSMRRAPRPRIGEGEPPVDYQDLFGSPQRWFSPNYAPDAGWNMPSFRGAPGTAGIPRLDAFPIPTQTVQEERIFEPVETGGIELEGPMWTAVDFHDLNPSGNGLCAACTFLFSENGEPLELELETAEPTRLFCNRETIADITGWNAGRVRASVRLKPGWNRLLLLQTPESNGAGAVMRFPGRNADEFRLYQDMISDAPPMWNIAGPLRMPLADATPALQFERLDSRTFGVELDRLANPGALLRNARFMPRTGAGTDGAPLAEAEYRVYKLDTLRYGYLRVELEASAGDLVDFSLGFRRTENGFPWAGRNCCRTHTVRCRQGNNLFISFTPGDAEYLMVSVRRAKGAVNLLFAAFDELAFPLPERCAFHSSEPWMNELWETGLAVIRRGAALVPPPRNAGEFDRCLLDSYMDSVNMAVVYGDFDYAAARLRQFLEAQYEDGDIPVLGCGGPHGLQLQQMFFLPAWMLFNYRQSGDRTELESQLPQLAVTLDFFENSLSDNGELWYAPGRPSAECAVLFHDDAPDQGVPTGLNSLFCRFLLSTIELYGIVGYDGSANHCRKLLKKVSARIAELNFDANTRLFNSNTIPARNDRSRMFVNLCALFGGVLPLEQFETFFYAFFNFDPPFDQTPESDNPYFNFLFMDILFSLGLSDWAFRYFRNYWERRTVPGVAAWKFGGAGDPEPNPARFCRGRMHTPNPILVREFAGIRPSDPGYSGIFLNPALSQARWIDVTVPTPRGPVRVKWEKKENGVLSVKIDSAYPLKVLPELSPEQLQSTEFELTENVVLLRRPTAAAPEERD